MTNLSAPAQVAKIIKQHCKSLGIQCTAKSERFSMGDSVRVRVIDQPPETMKSLQEFASPYQYGHFDGMTDMYEYSNSRKDIPQTKYLFVDNEYSDGLRQAAWDFMREHISEASSGPSDVTDNLSCHRMGDQWADQALYMFLNGATTYSELSAAFWASRATSKKSETPSTINKTACTIEEHTHTKKGFQMFIVVLAERIERDEFNTLLQAAKNYGGWYSRAWKDTPGGFAFKSEGNAHKFAELLEPARAA